MNSSRSSTWQHGIRSLPFVVVLVTGVAGFFALSSLRKVPETRARGKLAPLVQTTFVQSGRAVLQLEVDGEVIPYRQVALSAQVQGRIVSKGESCRAGHYVQRGDLLLMIDPRDYDLEVERTQQLIKQTEVNIEELDVERANTEEMVALAEEDLALQARELDRVRSLIERQATSQAAVDTAQRGRIQAVNSLQALRNQDRLLETRRGRFLIDKERLLVELQRAMLDRQRCEIRAPIDGVIVEDMVEQDDFVQPGGTLVRIEDTDRVEVRFDLKLSQLRWVWESVGRRFDDPDLQRTSYELPSLPINVSYDADESAYAWQGVLSRYDEAGLNPATRTVPCVGVVTDPRGGKWQEGGSTATRWAGPPTLLRGMFVRVRIEVPTSQPLLEIPLIALQPGNRVWLLRDQQLVVVPVEVAQTVDDDVLLFSTGSEVREGDALVVSPLSLAVDGMKVRVDPHRPLPSTTLADEPRRATSQAEVTLGDETPDGSEKVSR